MSEARAASAVGAVLSTAFAGDVPGWASDLAAELINNDRVNEGKIGVGVGATGPSLWASAESDDQAFVALIRGRWGEASAFLSSCDPGVTQFLLHVSADGARLLGTRDEPVATDGGMEMGLFRDLISGEAGTLLVSESAPIGSFSGQDVRVSAMAGLPSGQWLTLQVGSTATAAILLVIQPDAAACTALAGVSAGLQSLMSAADSAQLSVSVSVIEVLETGELETSVWLSWGVDRQADLPAMFSAGAPDAETFASSLDEALFEGDRAGARSLILERIYPQLTVGTNPGEAKSRLADLWLALNLRFSLVPPFERPAVVEEAARIADAIGLQHRAVCVAAARYLADHENAPPPPFEIPAQLASLSETALVAEATQLLEALGAARGSETAAEHYKGVNAVLDLNAAEANLNAAISGSFLAAEGAMHAYLTGLGPLGYDDDEQLAGLEGVDLEMGDEEITRALLDDDF